MRTLNRVLTVLVITVGLALAWAAVAKSGWGLTRSVLGIGGEYSSPLQPLSLVVVTLLVVVTGTLLIEQAWQWLRPKQERIPPRADRSSNEQSRPPAGSNAG